MLKILESGDSLPTTFDYPLAVWQFGEDLTFVGLSGEVVAAPTGERAACEQAELSLPDEHVLRIEGSRSDVDGGGRHARWRRFHGAAESLHRHGRQVLRRQKSQGAP